MSKDDIYGRDPQPDIQNAVDMAMKCMKGVGKTSEAAEVDGKHASDSHDITENLGQAKP